MSHAQIGCREGIDSQLLVVWSQTASLTPDPSFAHNLGCRCPNCQCEGIFDIYVSRPFQRHQENPNARCFAPCCRALNIRESRRTPNPHFSKCWASPPYLTKLGLRHQSFNIGTHFMVFFYHGLVYNVSTMCVDNILAHTHIMFSSTTNLLEAFQGFHITPCFYSSHVLCGLTTLC
jgi:hypothetical protein